MKPFFISALAASLVLGLFACLGIDNKNPKDDTPTITPGTYEQTVSDGLVELTLRLRLHADGTYLARYLDSALFNEERGNYQQKGNALFLTNIEVREPGGDWETSEQPQQTLQIRNVTANSFQYYGNGSGIWYTVVRVADQDPGAPLITSHPDDAVVPPGGTASFTVEAEGEELSFQWIRDDSDTLHGKTDNTLYLFGMTEALDGTTYKCVVRNPYGVVVSHQATLTVFDLAAYVPRSVLLDTGAVLFTTCAGCHGINGRGHHGFIPPLANSDFFMNNRRKVIEIVLNGGEDSLFVNGMWYQNAMMPAWWESLEDVQIAGILTYLRATLNDSTVVSCDEPTWSEEEGGYLENCIKTPRTDAERNADSVAVWEVKAVRDSLGLPSPSP